MQLLESVAGVMTKKGLVKVFRVQSVEVVVRINVQRQCFIVFSGWAQAILSLLPGYQSLRKAYVCNSVSGSQSRS